MSKLFLKSGKLMYGSSLDDQGAVEVVPDWRAVKFDAENQIWWLLDPTQGIYDEMKEGQLYDLPSGWTVEDGWDEPCIKARRCLIADHENNDNCAQLHGNICQKKKRIARLVPIPVRAENAQGEIRKLIEGDIPPKYPSWANVTREEYHDAVAAITEAQRRALIDEGAPQKGIIITDNPEEVGQIYDFNQDVTGDKEYGTELSLVDRSDKQLNTLLDKVEGGIVATGIPEAGQPDTDDLPRIRVMGGSWGQPVDGRRVHPPTQSYTNVEAVPDSGEKPDPNFILKVEGAYMDRMITTLIQKWNLDYKHARDIGRDMFYTFVMPIYELGGQYGLKPVSPPSQVECESREVWNEMLDYCTSHMVNDIRLLEYLMEHYSLTRKTKP